MVKMYIDTPDTLLFVSGGGVTSWGEVLKGTNWRPREGGEKGREFSGGPVVKTLPLQCGGCEFYLWSGN